MSHHIYSTEAYVLEGRNVGEANKYFYLFTREMGMITATAQGVRLLKSKLRSSLRDFSCLEVSFVRGKQNWKITTAIGRYNLSDIFTSDHQVGGSNDKKLALVSRVFSLLRRLMRGEEKNERLYDLVANGLTFLVEEDLSSRELENFECAYVLGILHLLGYVGEKKEFEEFLVPIASRELLSHIEPIRQKALAEINRSLRESQL